uniref:Uncharacterized protein n=1 Tax=Ananas comosus var. bracteatus TaxID=296719 RepID=A0A6V7NES3_ANACO|nr:unnamed protein product [Ananas comosus var. bracteatus]
MLEPYFSSGIDSLVEHELNPKQIHRPIPRSSPVESRRGAREISRFAHTAKQNLLAGSAHHSLQQTHEIPDVPNSSLLVHNRFEPNIVIDQIVAKRGLPEDLSRRDPKRLRVDASMAATSVTREKDHLNENTYSLMIGNEVEPPLVLASFEEDRDRNPLIDAKTIVADPQDIASPRDSIPSRYNPEVDYETTPSVSKHDSDSPQDTWVVEEDVSDTNMVVSARTLIGNESKDNVDDTATTRYLEIKSVNGDDPIAVVGVSPENMLLKEGDGAGHLISSDHGVGQGSRPTLIDHLIEIVRTSNYHSYHAVQEKVTEYCEILSRMGVEILGLSTRLQKLFKEAEAIREVAAHPSYSSSARILKAKGHTSRITKELKDYDSKRSSLT